MNIEEFKRMLFQYTKEINESMNMAFHFLVEKYGLTLMQLRILFEIHRTGSHTIGSLAEAVHMAGTNISTMCKKLEKQGFVRRTRDQVDERIVRLELSEKGTKTMTEIDHYLNKRIMKVLEDETEETYKIIFSGMEKINILLQKIGKME